VPDRHARQASRSRLRRYSGALPETIFRFELVMRINVTTLDLLEREALIDAALSANLALAVAEDGGGPTRSTWSTSRKLRGLIAFRIGELRAVAEARTIAGRALPARPERALPRRGWGVAEQVKSTAMIADMAIRMAEIDGVPRCSTEPGSTLPRIAELSPVWSSRLKF